MYKFGIARNVHKYGWTFQNINTSCAMVSWVCMMGFCIFALLVGWKRDTVLPWGGYCAFVLRAKNKCSAADISVDCVWYTFILHCVDTLEEIIHSRDARSIFCRSVCRVCLMYLDFAWLPVMSFLCSLCVDWKLRPVCPCIFIKFQTPPFICSIIHSHFVFNISELTSM